MTKDSSAQKQKFYKNSRLREVLTRSFPAVKCFLAARPAEIICACLLFVMAAAQFAIINRKSITADEIVMIPSAYYYIEAGTPRFVREHPPLSKMLASAPLPFINLTKMPSRLEVSPNTDWERLMRFWTDNSNKFEIICFWTRVPAVLFTCALGALIFVFAREMFGKRAAMFAVMLFSFEPTVLAHGHVVQTDIPAAFGYLLFFYALRRYLNAPAWYSAIGLGIATDLAAIAKFSMLLAIPVLGAVFLWMLWNAPREMRTRAVVAHFSLAAAAFLLFVNAAYLFRCNPFSDADARWVTENFPAHATAMTATLRTLSHFLPADFVLGIVWQIQHNSVGHPASLLGEYNRTGWWYYFPVAFALKTTLPFLFLSIASLTWGVIELLRRRDRRFLWLLAPFILYTLLVMMSQINIGVRYYLPAYPFLFIASGAFLDLLLKSPRMRYIGLALTVAIFIWIGGAAIRAYPDYMSYMNQLSARGQSWQYLSDSNIEWGDDVRGLAEFLQARGETEVRAITLGGYLTFRFYGIKDINLVGAEDAPLPETRYTAIGASFLNGSTVPEGRIHGRTLTDEERVNYFDAYRHRSPEAIIGSIYIFREHD